MNFDVGGDVVANCQQDFVLIHWYGYITMPSDGQIIFQSMADDGFYMAIGDTPVIDNWYLKGCGGGSGGFTFQAGVSEKIDAWFYEYGGGACNQLYYSDANGWQGLVPDSAFTTEAVAVVPPVVEPPVVEPPVVVPTPDPVPVDPPVVPPVVIPDPPVDPQPPVVPDPPVDPKPPVVVPPVVVPPVVVPPVVVPPVVVPPVVTPPVEVPTSGGPTTPEPSAVTTQDPSTIDPTTLTSADVAELQAVANETLAVADPGSPEYQKALDQLFVAAQADDIQVDPALAAIPGIGNVAVGLTNAINFVGNVGADMSPKTRKTAKKEVVVSVVAVGAAVQAAAGVTAVSSSSPSSRKKN
jgi:hypothetical protein